ncbi:MAG: TonB-dependent receptor [Rhizobiales bacterium]|nr:TonB-dependent receptor [Hyphomicrobiales bacterium]
MSFRSRLLVSVSVLAFVLQSAGATSAFAETASPPTTDAKPLQLPPVSVSKAAQKKKPAPRRKAASRPAPPQPRAPQQAQLADITPATPRRNQLSTAASALPASTSTINYADVAATPITSYGDVFRPLPGFYVSNYSQGAIGYGLALRGFTEAEHGRDVAVFIDGMPLNEVSSLHTPNYVDLNPLLPETVRSIEVIRGPFSVEYGDSNLGGSINIVTKHSEPFASIGTEGGSFGTFRGVGTYSQTGGWMEPFIVVEGYRTDGYRENSYINRLNAFNKFTMPVADGLLSVRVQAYETTSGAASYINRDAVLAGTLSPRHAVNSTDGTDRSLQNIVANYVSGERDQELTGTFYVNRFDHDRYADFGSGQRVQHDDRVYLGGTVRKVWTGAVYDAVPIQVLVGSNWRTDFINTLQASTETRQIIAKTLDVGVDQTNLAGFAQVQVKPVQWLKLTGGARYDHYYYDIDDKLTFKQINTDSGVWSPKGGFSITPLSWLEIFGNYGEGARSPNAPLELLGNPSLTPYTLKSKEIGGALRLDRWMFQASFWTTDIANEIFQAAPLMPLQNLGRSRREGYDLETRYWILRDRQNDWNVFANFTEMRAELLDRGPSKYVPNVPQWLLNIGTEFSAATKDGERLSGMAFVSFIGKKYMSEDGLIATPSYQRVNAKVAYSWPTGWSAYGQAVWYPSDKTSEIAIDFGPAVGVLTSPMPGLTLMAGLKYQIPTSDSAPSRTANLVMK